MTFTYEKATLDDLELLTETRIEVLRAANQLGPETDLSLVRKESRRYYEAALKNGTHCAYLVFDGDRFAGSGGISYYQVMPTVHNPSGWKGYIMNMYTRPAYRRQGLALHTLELLVQDARNRSITAVSLEATDSGRPLYQKYGFVDAVHEMMLPEA